LNYHVVFFVDVQQSSKTANNFRTFLLVLLLLLQLSSRLRRQAGPAVMAVRLLLLLQSAWVNRHQVAPLRLGVRQVSLPV
jgi:hypothetical protein